MKGYFVTVPDVKAPGPFPDLPSAFAWLYSLGFERDTFTAMYVLPGHMTLAVDGQPEEYRIMIDHLGVVPGEVVA